MELGSPPGVCLNAKLFLARSFLAAATKCFVDDGLELLNHFIGWRFVIVHFIHHAQEFVLAQAEAVIR
jgi:hypothetical protein